MGIESITIQVCSQLANIYDPYVRKFGHKNPLDVPEDVASFRSKGRGDRALLDKLALGEGVGSSKQRATFTGQHIRSYQMNPAQKGRININIQTLSIFVI
jgi:hypothetical protein